jgi:hypothetical protein
LYNLNSNHEFIVGGYACSVPGNFFIAKFLPFAAMKAGFLYRANQLKKKSGF